MDSNDNKIKKSLRFSFLDGIFASLTVGLTQEYFIPFLLLLGAGTRHVGFLAAFPNLFASLIQLKSADLTRRLRSRKRIICSFVFFQALMLLVIAIIAFLGRVNLYLFIIAVIIFTSFGAIVMPPWASLMSDLIKPDKRGEYFGWRNKRLGFITVIATFVAGFILHLMKRVNIFYGFSIILSLAFIFRLVSWYFLTRMYEPHLDERRENCFTLFDFLARIKESNFARFVIFVAMMNFSTNLISPFLSVLMLKDLSFSYLLYTSIIVTATLTSILTMKRWGMHADQMGNIKIIKLTARLIGIIPLLWVVSRHPLFLFFAQAVGGFLWAGFNLCASNFIYDAVIPEKRTRCIAYFNVINGIALSGGALLGGFLVQKLPRVFGYRILTLCLISAALRIFIAFIMSANIREVRPVKKLSSNKLFFSIIGIRPVFENR